MKTSLSLLGCCCFAWMVFIDGCLKDELTPHEHIYRPHLPPPIIKNSYTEEFTQHTNVMEIKGWVFWNHSSDPNTEGWHKDYAPDGKSPNVSDLSPAYSGNNDPHAFAYANTGINQAVDMWMLTPPIELRNGDKISFYAKMNTQTPDSINLLEVRLNPSDTTSNAGNSIHQVGQFSLLLGKVFDEYPRVWTKKEFVISGLNGTIRSRIALRYYIPVVTYGSSIGIDVLKFEKM
ncbi:MAG TPA: choice-of-anchor J domain-containing protein [Flavisolibacter sp.]|nr:choice-of-anchor J domain-containing protein [Flavisolibacter sp.]